VSLVKAAGGTEGGRGQLAPVNTHASFGGFRPGGRKMHQEVFGCPVAATLEHHQSGRRVAMEVGGSADLGGLTPPALSAPRPLPPVSPALGFSVATEGCCMQGRLEPGGRAGILLLGLRTRALACMHTHFVHTVGHASALLQSLAIRASWSMGVCADAP